MIIFLGALVGMLYYLRAIQWVVEIGGGAIAWLLRTSKVESLHAATVMNAPASLYIAKMVFPETEGRGATRACATCATRSHPT